ncbi:WYL domain-containing protein [Streptomyces ipomoeae]|uniref:WYL domain-containing protein n=1 Tax=Streptomyces ipomoeae TaxID=103232 RepID=UPI0011472008|nr:WYL domain-containing protein [Streptomyces ipomoeae]TQE33032.1 hypothetical protein Sipo7851_21240 [Streptomyces ipomoeae]
MRHTRNQTTRKTLTDLFRALDRQHAVTITCLKEEKDERGRKTGNLVETVRTIEIYDLTTTAEGNILIRAMDRESGEQRDFRLDRLLSYTLHRSPYRLPQPTTDDADTPVLHTEADVITWEIARDDAAYWTEFRSNQTLAA